ncbi:MAG: DUF4166 domain-containing protein [Methylobacteriaceae bacterium]|nr:DUF4166 domain-containing protein [Methylobacteriaceae bacterium]
MGGTGAFGRRLVERLAATTDLDIIIAGRSLERAQALADALRPIARGNIAVAALDRDALTAAAIVELGAAIVVDAAGPFQGREPLVARAAIEARCHYIDLADARDFVSRFPQLHDAAHGAGVMAITGASSTPALSHAVLDHLTAGWQMVSRVEIAISPGNRAPRGASAAKAILSFVGKPVRVWLDGAWRNRFGWSGLQRVNVPGLGRRWLSLCETPDLDLVPARFPSVRSASFRAGLELGVLHFGMWALGLIVCLRLIPSLVPLARPLLWIARQFDPFGTDRGAMLVEAAGMSADGRPVVACWRLVAAPGVGPNVPVLPALALVRRLAAGLEPRAGAFAAAGLLSLDDVAREFAPLDVATSAEAAFPQPLFARLLGDRFDNLPAPIRALHSPVDVAEYIGEADVEGPSNGPARWIAAMIGFPAPGKSLPVRVEIRAGKRGEIWQRKFGTIRFRSHLSQHAKSDGLTERFGPFAIVLALSASDAGIDMKVTGWHMGPLPLPRGLAPWTIATERAAPDGRFCFDIEIGLPLVGRLVRYRGWLVPRPAASPQPEAATSLDAASAAQR